jgi:hypothetical protein
MNEKLRRRWAACEAMAMRLAGRKYPYPLAVRRAFVPERPGWI